MFTYATKIDVYLCYKNLTICILCAWKMGVKKFPLLIFPFKMPAIWENKKLQYMICMQEMATWFEVTYFKTKNPMVKS